MKPVLLETAGLRTRIRADSESLLELLATRFGGFISEDNGSAFDVRISVDTEAPPHTHAAPDFSIEEGRVFFELPGYIGFIDPHRAASLRIASNTPATGADYFLRVVCAMLAFHAGGLMVHAAGIVRHGRAYLFFGHSGSGKTTVAQNSPEDLILNDDLVILLPEEGGWRAFGTPFTNPTQHTPSPESAPLAALLRLVHSPRVYTTPLTGARAVAELLSSVPVLNRFPSPPLDRVQDILQTVPAHQLHLLPDSSFWPAVEDL